ncbi:uncharacterized protein LOC124910767 isoform X1 [Impatiens glandulifera]|uniref:uncharacterized protein LOC124910767 isoform X1 n=1 Tax=Impatiens glandulifera TaxID=253017 RepID=UPI001FB18394|nr:uncharacterized protein LOC124910767 isoform X1 [Impatiens glandulifera]
MNPAPPPSETNEELEKKFVAYVCTERCVWNNGSWRVVADEDTHWHCDSHTLDVDCLLRDLSDLHYVLSPNQADEQEDYAHMCGWRRAVIISMEIVKIKLKTLKDLKLSYQIMYHMSYFFPSFVAKRYGGARGSLLCLSKWRRPPLCILPDSVSQHRFPVVGD